MRNAHMYGRPEKVLSKDTITVKKYEQLLSYFCRLGDYHDTK
jgi:hypothetical protein